MASRSGRILAISFHNQRLFDEMYGPLLTAIRCKAEFQRAENLTTAMQFLSQQPEPTAILITDAALTLRENLCVWEAVLQYVSRGGVAVIMGLFSSFVKPNRIKTFFSKSGLPWESGSYHRTTLKLNQAVVDAAIVGKLVQRYSQKAVFVNKVAPGDMWYRTDEDSVTQSLVFPPTSAHNTGETAVALAKVGEGKLGYVGDVNAEDGSNAVMLAMCGLL